MERWSSGGGEQVVSKSNYPKYDDVLLKIKFSINFTNCDQFSIILSIRSVYCLFIKAEIPIEYLLIQLPKN